MAIVLDGVLSNIINQVVAVATPSLSTNDQPMSLHRRSNDDEMDRWINDDDAHRRIYNPALGQWSYVSFAFNLISIFLSSIVIIVVIWMAFKRKDVAVKTSFRLSGWIALFDLLISITFIIRLFNSVMLTRTQMELRVLWWLNYYSALAFMFLTVCIVIQLQLTVLFNNKRLARVFDRFYETVSILLAAALTQPFLWFYHVQWDVRAQSIFADKGPRRNAMWGFFHAWMILGWFYCLIICIWVLLRLMPVWQRMRRVQALSFLQPDINEYCDSNRATESNSSRPPRYSNNTTGLSNSMAFGNGGVYDSTSPSHDNTYKGPNISANIVGSSQKRHARNAVLRIMLYPLIPIATRSVYIVSQIFPFEKSPFIPITFMISIQGLLNFVAFCLNPAMDEFWSRLVKKRFRKSRDGYQEHLPPAESDSETGGNPFIYELQKMDQSQVSINHIDKYLHIQDSQLPPPPLPSAKSSPYHPQQQQPSFQLQQSIRFQQSMDSGFNNNHNHPSHNDIPVGGHHHPGLGTSLNESQNNIVDSRFSTGSRNNHGGGRHSGILPSYNSPGLEPIDNIKII
ncbi:hypothetical protein H4219_003667 [Mycoemilia scoparia]|uniref:Uncharacterized protein n=1 Tax=Mycoemilia scoparia TaxID=417184 RepID=A0A9W7ZZK1_9FUNG|nr:hypothetical protein H4219_003667 [Mycoemilia scoparia]